MTTRILLAALLVMLNASDALAIQDHGDPEGFYVHQLAHIVFFAAMAFMVVVLKKPAVYALEGWRSIRRAAFLFLLWNVNTFISHEARHEMPADYIKGSVLYLKDNDAVVYYWTSMAEYFFLVPAFVFLAMGLDQLWKHLRKEDSE
ncbi:MAG: hypothetical protein HZA22_05755 [Nitrospirae bacterium]|nr:hypothetical protein [Nitrospirota bacterium]MBI5694369.1 hypothetical protein [Nitrospirota bacterium]